MKQDICACSKCLQGNLINCEFEPGKLVNSKYIDSSDVKSDNEVEGIMRSKKKKKNDKK